MSAARKKTGRNPDHIKHLVPDPENARKHNPKNIGVIVESLHAVGAARSIVIDEDNRILAGNGVIEASRGSGYHQDADCGRRRRNHRGGAAHMPDTETETAAGTGRQPEATNSANGTTPS